MNFYEYLLRNQDRDDKTGDFAKHVIADCNYPSDKPFLDQLKYLEEQEAPPAAILSLADTYKSFLNKK
jgi:uncharacterized protein YozE (UPF0346 family)|tara:strand:+ start:752 stop:955 length:204 start_codon:yes stop_codon:yes gene_type:complete